MECVKKTWLSLMCSANDLLKNGISFFSEMENGTPDDRSFGNGIERVLDLHTEIRKVISQLNNFDEDLWRQITSGLTNKTIQDPTVKAGTSNSISNNALTKLEKLKRRYEGLPFPVNAVPYRDEDVKKDTETFLSRFPVTETENQQMTVNQEYYPSPKMTPTNNIANSDERRSSRLSSGPPRKPRGSKPHPFLIANKIQREILSKPSLLSQPRKRKMADENSFEEEAKSQTQKDKLNIKVKTREVKKSSEPTPIKKTKNENPLKNSPMKSAESKESKTPTKAKSAMRGTPVKTGSKTKNKLVEDGTKKGTKLTAKSNKCDTLKKTNVQIKKDTPKKATVTAKTKNESQGSEKRTKPLTAHFVAKKGYRKIHRPSKKQGTE